MQRFPPTALNVGLSIVLGHSEQLKTHSDYTLAPTEADSLINNFSQGPPTHKERNLSVSSKHQYFHHIGLLNNPISLKPEMLKFPTVVSSSTWPSDERLLSHVANISCFDPTDRIKSGPHRVSKSTNRKDHTVSLGRWLVLSTSFRRGVIFTKLGRRNSCLTPGRFQTTSHEKKKRPLPVTDKHLLGDFPRFAWKQGGLEGAYQSFVCGYKMH